jgi:hypothetical protein
MWFLFENLIRNWRNGLQSGTYPKNTRLICSNGKATSFLLHEIMMVNSQNTFNRAVRMSRIAGKSPLLKIFLVFFQIFEIVPLFSAF